MTFGWVLLDCGVCVCLFVLGDLGIGLVVGLCVGGLVVVVGVVVFL